MVKIREKMFGGGEKMSFFVKFSDFVFFLIEHSEFQRNSAVFCDLFAWKRDIFTILPDSFIDFWCGNMVQCCGCGSRCAKVHPGFILEVCLYASALCGALDFVVFN